MAEFFAGGHLRFLSGAWRDDNGDPVDVVKRERGEWVHKYDSWLDPWLCSVCGDEWHFEYDPTGIETRVNFCPNCGADMRPEGGAEG